jgi:molybdopterin-guanine dinucleotide biosynthesis protein B
MKGRGPAIFCIIGKKNSGKTGVTVALAAELTRRGRRVMTVKHGHGFRLDQPGKDSWRHRHEGGALRTVLAGPGGFAVVGAWPEREMGLRELVDRFLPDADIVLAEGFKAAPEPKIEVYRTAAHPEALYEPGAESGPPFIAMMTDAEAFEAPFPVLHLDDKGAVARLADLVDEAARQ